VTATFFADSSAVVKLYADEFGADAVRSLSLVVVSQLARVEVPAALWRKHRRGELTANDTAVLIAEFEADYFGDGTQLPRFSVIAVTAPILEHAAYLVGVHGLRAYDAVQLASACAAKDAVVEEVAFAAFDKALRDAAAAQGLALLPE
jgi:predicted nucleic acid-binding protein